MKKSFIISLIVLFVAIGARTSNAQCISQLEFEALVALYNATNGDNWTNNTGWNINATACDVTNAWYGVTIEGGHVTYLYLQNNNLSGSLPLEIGNLSGLSRLYAYNNLLSGPIPVEIGLLSNLEYLRLENNQINGQIPAQIGSLTGLRVLHLGGNNLAGSIPAEIYNLIKLSGFQLSDNQLTGTISLQIGNLTNLRSLYLWGNQFTGSIPPEIGNLSNLVYLHLRQNQLSGSIPNEIGNLSALQLLSIQQNQLSGTLPASIGNLTNLKTLKIGNNQLEGAIPESIFNLTNLSNCQLNDNQFSGTVPSNIGNLVNLQYAYFNGNQFTGNFPPIAGLSNLITLRLNFNQFENLGDLSGLNTLSRLQINNNHFSFEDIEPNLSLPNFTYSPQAKVGNELEQSIVKGMQHTISVNVGGANNTYQWYKNAVIISGANETSYTITNFSESDVAVYYCEIKNTLATELTLLSNDINLAIIIGSITIDATNISGSPACTLSGVVTETQFPASSTYNFVPDALPGTAILALQYSASEIKRIRFDIDNNYTISNMQIEINATYIPMYNAFYFLTKNEESLHSVLQLYEIENICVYYPD